MWLHKAKKTPKFAFTLQHHFTLVVHLWFLLKQQYDTVDALLNLQSNYNPPGLPQDTKVFRLTQLMLSVLTHLTSYFSYNVMGVCFVWLESKKARGFPVMYLLS